MILEIKKETYTMSLNEELTVLLNKHSIENGSNTPDFILAEYLINCLNAWSTAVNHRDSWSE